ncbi:hypothetical protein [Breoghania sp.]|uniref:hypothetical protein n=1 Tax=Breoghania sp. TaxID=2065378 RepID=UPI0026346908|nr:hypothetical protein [Breoghania sp.]MDJ0932578.1 hypothetical protein [Breoghania sp.]
MAGVRLYLGGKSRTLIQRHREDDPGDQGLRAIGQALEHLQEREEKSGTNKDWGHAVFG